MKGVDSKLQNVFNEVVKEFDCAIIEGVRSQERQNELVAQGKSKTKFGKHVQGKALDVAPYPIDWADRDRFHYFGGYVKGIAKSLNLKVRWGGDWDGDFETKDNIFDDLVHFEILDE
jgi:peptidoglycan L-alanyl-D-glutamate endopeptidase CwlK